jgi:DNA-binding NtrC family response regulator
MMKGLTAWGWPGNIRELENFIERAVTLTRGKTLEVPLTELRKAETQMATDKVVVATKKRTARRELSAKFGASLAPIAGEGKSSAEDLAKISRFVDLGGGRN